MSKSIRQYCPLNLARGTNAFVKVFLWLLLSAFAGAAAWAQAPAGEKGGAPDPANAVQSINAAQKGGIVALRVNMRAPLAQAPVGFSVTNPDRIALDFPGVENALGKNNVVLNEGAIRSVNLVDAGGRLRMVLNLDRAATFQTQIEGNDLFVTVTPVAAADKTGGVTHFAPRPTTTDAQTIRDISFRRGQDGEGRIVVDLGDANTGIDIQHRGEALVVEFLKTSLPDNLKQRVEVDDFATPVSHYVATQQGQNARLAITPKGLWEHTAYQSDNQFVIEIKKIIEDPNKLVQGTRGTYQGEKLSLNFQNVDVRRLLQVIGEFTNMNMVVSDSVSGSITLILKDVPWDQALDIILKQKGLDMRKNGNVISVAPRDELIAQEKLQLEALRQIDDLETLRTESFQLNYQKAAAVRSLLLGVAQAGAGGGGVTTGAGSQRMLSKRGSAVVDVRTNMLFVQDVPSRLEEVRRLLNKIDIPVRQVMIEARIVEADDNFSRNLGVRLGIVDLRGASGDRSIAGNDGARYTVGGALATNAYLTGQSGAQPDFSQSLGVNLPAAAVGGAQPGALSFTLFNAAKTVFVNTELSALEADGRGKVISSPRVITADQKDATIEQGVEIPYQEASTAGNTSVSFRKAVLSLQVTPHITPDGKVIMALKVNKDTPNTQLFTGAGVAIDTKRVETEVLVENGGTVVIGGIYTQELRETTNKIPLLGDVPYLGWLFKQNSKIDNKTELLVFITPRIVGEGLSLR
ncbi:MAG: type IV pilus secretin PilQ [Betaproteobacteria bacterium]|nr:type IV pilus secretin PilQ [Betaproteobacteria bacterium]